MTRSFTDYKKTQKKKNDNVLFPIIILVILIFWGSFKIVPQSIDLYKKTQAIQILEIKESELPKEIEDLEESLEKINKVFEEKTSEFVSFEEKIFPEKFSISNVSKTLELYSIQNSIVENTDFKINKLSFSNTSEQDGKYQTQISIDFIGTNKILKDFIKFVKTGELNEEMKNARLNKGLDSRQYNFIKNNLFPISIINSMKITESENPNSNNIFIKLTSFSRE